MGRFCSNSVGNKGRGIKDLLNHRVVHTSIRDSPPGTMGEKETEKRGGSRLGERCHPDAAPVFCSWPGPLGC